MTLADIVRLASHAHDGQADKQRRDYFDAHLRPIAEASLVFGPQALQAAWLHDILEDSTTTAANLTTQGVDPDLIRAVEAVTKRESEPYPELIQRSAADPIGRFVKLVDNAWNIACSPALAEVDPERAQTMLADKYLPAREVLLEATGLSLDSEDYQAVTTTLARHVQRLAGALPTITLTPRNEGHGWLVDGDPVDEVYENESGLAFQTTSADGNVDSYLTLPYSTYPAVRTALRQAEDAEVLSAILDQLAGILAIGISTWAAAHGIETESFTYASNDFWDVDNQTM